MTLTVVSYTGRNGVADSTVNNNTNYTCRLADMPIVDGGSGFYTNRGDGQDPNLGGVKLKGKVLRLNVQIRSGAVTAGMKFWAGLLDPHDTATKTIIFTDGSIQWQATGRNNGISKHLGGGNFVAEMLLDRAVLYTVATTTESTFAVTSDGASQGFTLATGNVDALPIYDISPQGAGGFGQRYRRFLDTFNWTKVGGAIGYHINITGAAGLDTSALVNFSSITAKVNGAINASVTTIAYDNPAGGAGWTNLALPFMMYRAGEQIRVTARTGGPTYASGNLTVVRGVNGSTATTHADNVDFSLSKAAFDGRDLRVLVGDGNGGVIETPYWFGTSGTTVFNNTGTYIWILFTYAARALGTLTNAITDTDLSLTLTSPEGYIDPTNGLLLIDHAGTREVVTYSTYDPSTATTPDLTRGAKGSTAAAHAAGVTVRAISEIWLYYGNPSATAPNYNVSPYVEKKPVFNLATSTNTSWVYNTFATAAQNNIYEWKPSSTGGGITYSTDRDPTGIAQSPTVVELGVSALTRLQYAAWYLSLIFGFTSATFTNVDRYNVPTGCAFVADNINDKGVATVVAPTTAVNAWQTTASLVLTSASVSFFARLYINNKSNQNFSYRAAVNVETVTVALSTATTSDTNGVPYVLLGAEQDVTYDMAGRLENVTTGESLSFVFDNMAIGSILRIDTLNKTITYVTDGRKTNPLPYKARENWLKLIQGLNTIKFWGWNVGTINVIVKYQGRSDTFA